MLKLLPRLVPFVVILLLGNSVPAQTPPGARQFPPGSWTRLDELPTSRLRSQLEQLPPAAQERSRQWLRSFHFTTGDLQSLHADHDGGIFYTCAFDATKATSPAAPVTGAISVPITPFPTNLVFHSRPGSANLLYLNFNGENVSGTQWNTVSNRTVFNAVPFSIDSDYANFSDSEQLAIKRIWQRVSEDYAPFDIDVTTERPATFNNRTAHALITRSTDANGLPNPASNAGGVAYVNVFNTTTYASVRPAWIYSDNLGPGEESFIAEAASHEIGHNMGLSHDGTSSTGYYGGHGSGDISWGPIMGTGYFQNVSQWSKGEYYQANNTEDDLAIISGKLNYRTDDFGGTNITATALTITGLTNITSTTPETDPANSNPANKGIIERNTDVDVFSFVTGNGPILLNINPWITASALTRGGNLDILAELRDDSGTLLLANNPANLTTAVIQTNLPAGRYYLYVRNTGTGNPLSSTPTGYTSYGSIGQFFLSGYIADPTGIEIAPSATLAVSDITSSGQGNHSFSVTYFDDGAVSVASINSTDVRVTGPNGYNQLAQFVSVDNNTDGTPRTATYQVPPPNGTNWITANNGTYTITMLSNQVSDTQGAFVPPSQLGQFQVTVPLTFYTANMNTDPGWTLDPLWAYGAPGYASGFGPTSGYTGVNIIGYNLTGNYQNSLTAKYATTPPINCSGSATLALHFRRWLGLRNLDTAAIDISTNGVTWVNLWTTSSPVSDSSWQDIQLSLPAEFAGAPNLQVRWSLASNVAQSSIGWNLDDVEITGTASVDNAPPVASLSATNLSVGGSTNYTFAVTYSDATAVSLSTLDSSDIMVTGPAGYSNLASFVVADLPLDGSPIKATYTIPAPGGTWDYTDDGTYTLTLLAGQVKDTLNNAVTQSVLGSFTVSIPAPGVLGVTPSTVFSSSGFVGGPFAPAQQIFTLTNAGGTSLNWSANATANWIDLSATNGVLAAGAATNVSASLNGSANSLASGNYTNVVSLLNTTTGAGNTQRLLTLSVSNFPTVTLSVSASPADWGSVSPASGSYLAGTNLQLLATPAPYYQFSSWSGDVTGATNPLPLALTSNLSAQANFIELLTTNFSTPLWWLAANGITNDFDNAVATAGSNGLALWQSYLAGLDPNNPASQLLLHGSFVTDSNMLVLNWNTVTGRVYTVLARTNLAEPFVPLPEASNLPSTTQSITNVISPDSPVRFFLLEVQKP